MYALSGLSLISLDFDKDIEIDENGNEKVRINSNLKKESIIDKIFKKILYPKCPKCHENAIVSINYMVHK